MKAFYFSLFLAAALSANAQNEFDSQSGNVLDALSGNISGMNVLNYSGDPTSEGPSIFINGVHSMWSNNPLIVVDGIIYDGDVSSINPNDVKTVTVHQGANQMVKFGSRAQNGVIEITTKNGNLKYLQYNNSGLGGKKELLRFRGKWGANSNAIGQYDLLGREETLGYLSDYGPYYLGAYGNHINYYDELMTTSLRHEYSADYSKMLDKGSVYGSIGYLDNGGVIKGGSNKRLTARFNAEYKLTDRLKAGVNASFAYHDKQKSVLDDDLLKVQANTPILTENSGYLYDKTRYDYKQSTTYSQLSLKAFADLKIAEGLNLNANIAYLTYSPSSNLEKKKGSLESEYDYNDKGYVMCDSEISTQSYTRDMLSPELKLTWSKQWGESGLTLTGGYKHYKNSITDRKNKYNKYSVLITSNSGGYGEGRDYDMEDKYDSYSASAYYNINRDLHVEASVNRQSSNIIGYYDEDNKWFNNWAVGAGWTAFDIITSSLCDTWFDNVYLYANYGVIGNDRVTGSLSDYITKGYPGFEVYRSISVLLPTDDGYYNNASNYYEEAVVWEKHHVFTAGVNFSSFLGKVNGGLQFFHNVNKDIFRHLYKLELINDGDMSNTGVNFYLNAKAEIGNVKWNIGLDLSHYRNKVKNLDEKYYKLVNSSSYANATGSVIKGYYSNGDDISVIKKPEYVGIDEYTGYGLWYLDEDMTTTTHEWGRAYKRDRGTNTPDLFGGLSNTLYYRDFDFTFNVGFQIGGKVYDYSYIQMMKANLGIALHKDYQKYDGLLSSEIKCRSELDAITDASYLNINKVGIGYRLPKSMLRSTKIASLRIYADADNLALFSARKGMDPRCFTYNTSNYSNGFYPMMRTISVGVEASF